ncbi:MAG: type I-D CRISPR-associated helicase Cas3' [Anaerolineae bacterium]|nr:type I-D CRISPR-associated helicase Cas3' [Anaerolineae bacterium]
MHSITLKSVDSRYATQTELDEALITRNQIPPDWRLMAHQAATVRALRMGDARIIVNEAMTGDGKSLTGQFRLRADGDSTITMYPTNELIRDQRRALDQQQAVWSAMQVKLGVPLIEEINAAVLDAIQDGDEYQPSRAQVVRRLLDSDLVLTNPDIFHLLMQFHYHEFGAAPDLIAALVATRFALFVFDEFHLFGTPQVASVLSAMLLLRAMSGAKSPRFLFLSATPQDSLLHYAQSLKLPVVRIQGDYAHGLASTPSDYRRILQPANLNLYAERMEDWITSHWEDLVLPFFAAHRPGAKGVILCNSVATAYRVYHRIKALEDISRIRIGLNTGLTPRELRAKDGEFDLLVATSTVDVGVDFRINFLVFESFDAATHIQRLGRLGRHTTSTDGVPFEVFEAHALLPGWVVEGLATRFAAGMMVDRVVYRDAISEAFPALQTFPQYPSRWGGVQMMHVIRGLNKPPIRAAYEGVRARLETEYPLIARNYKAKYLDLTKNQLTAIRDEACSFRGGSPLHVLVVDRVESNATVVTYDLMGLLLRAELEDADLTAFYRLAQRNGQSEVALKRSDPLAAFWLRGWLDNPRRLYMRLDYPLREHPELLESVVEIQRVRVNAPGVPGMADLNHKLEARTLVAFMVRGEDPAALRRMLRLGLQLELYPFESTDNVTGSIAFARDALLLDTVWRRRATDGDPLLI